MKTFVQMLSLKYYGVVHRADTDDYTQSLRSLQELDKNNFQHFMYVVRAKSSDEAPPPPEIRYPVDAISEFDDDEEVEEARATEPHRRKVSDVDTNLADPTESPQTLRTIDVSAQLFLSCKRTRGEQLGFIPYAAGGVFGRLEQKHLRQDERDTDSDSEGLWIDGNPEFNLGRSPWSPGSHSPQRDDAVAERRRKNKK
jgi:hypothetical protein